MKRPNPDELLAQAERDETLRRRGRLRIYFGYAAGVGKTYAMLEAAHREKKDGVDIVVGYVEPHGRKETEELLHGLEVLRPKRLDYRGVTLREFDLDAALARRPGLILVDELAHTNAEGSRHAKRWQDVNELLEAGIDVFTTLNVQHVESLNDVVAQISGVVVRETLPDAVLEQANEIELVDLTPEELIERLRVGKVYVPAQAERALQHFFQMGNLTALREMSLRQVALRLGKEVEAARLTKSVQSPWPSGERLLVCVGPSPTSSKLIRSAKRMASAFGAEWLAVAVESRQTGFGKSNNREHVLDHLRLAEKLGAETHTLVGDDVAQTVIDFAVSRNVTKIVVGKTQQSWLKRFFFGTVVDALLDRSGAIDVYVIRGEPEERTLRAGPKSPPTVNWNGYLGGALVVAACGLMGWASHVMKLAEANVVMFFLLGVAIVAARFGRGPAIAAAVVSVLAFDFFFVAPTLTFTVNDVQYVITFAVMLIIGVLISTLTVRLKEKLQSSQSIQKRTAALFRLTKQLSEVAGPEFLMRTAGQQLQLIFDGDVVIFFRSEAGADVRFGEQSPIAHNETDRAVAQWVCDHEHIAGPGTDTLPNASALYVPLIGSQRTIGAVGVRPNQPDLFSDPEQIRLLETCASLIALSLERDQSVIEASEANLRVQAEELRSSLLSSVSHDLRTPLAVISAAGSSLLDSPDQDKQAQRETLQSIVHESHRLTRLVENLLDMTRLEAGAVVPNKQWHVLEEIVGSALARVRKELTRHHVTVSLSPDLPLTLLDDVLMEQVIVNLLENAARYTPPGSDITISAKKVGNVIEIRVADNGPGLPPGMEANILKKFIRGVSTPSDGRRGVGLGLAICQAIIQTHGGNIVAKNRAAGGAEFIITLPCDQEPPHVVTDAVLSSSQE